ncbi:polyisoprenoid-binding protein [Paucibacter sp. KBW04]|uniref:YceI family protein n=1 Tax=Paucibacter sp. KBW04 TaxID=2153361 RepID=UPI000F55AB2F|nr:YceI family protein [Paucibacter sp. KBW04]RQO56959.1 polyisoprenoid-binding protein [Paucibacter sp. KBW04]
MTLISLTRRASLSALILLAGAPGLSLAQAKPAAKAAPAAVAAAPQLLPAQSELTFAAKQMGVPVEGRFKRFEAKLAFDPKKPEAGSVAFSIDLGSATLGAAEFDAELAKPAWFDSKKLPQATFQSTAIKALGGGKFKIAGKLSIKGQTRDLNVPISLNQAAGTTTATGTFVLKRLEFKIGEGDWADTSMVANEVQVKFKLAFSGLAPL